MKSHRSIIKLFFIAILFLFGCSEKVKVHFEIENPRGLGTVSYVEYDGDKAVRISDVSSDKTKPVLNYEAGLIIILELKDGTFVAPMFFRTRFGFMSRVYSEKTDEKKERLIDPKGVSIMILPRKISKVYLVVRSFTENISYRVMPIDPEIIINNNPEVHVVIPDILTLNKIDSYQTNEGFNRVFQNYKKFRIDK